MGRRRSTRIALKQSLTPTNRNHDDDQNIADDFEDQIENEEKDISQTASMQNTASLLRENHPDWLKKVKYPLLMIMHFVTEMMKIAMFQLLMTHSFRQSTTISSYLQ